MDAKTYLVAALGLFVVGCGGSRHDAETARAPAPATQPAHCQDMTDGHAACEFHCSCAHCQAMGAQRGPRGQGGRGPHMHGRGMGRGMGPKICPMGIPVTSIRAEEAASGPALAFTTDAAHVEVLREQVEEMAARHNQRRAEGATPPGRRGAMHPNMRAAEAYSEPTDDGAQLVYVPGAGTNAEELRAEVESQASFAADHCPIYEPGS